MTEIKCKMTSNHNKHESLFLIKYAVWKRRMYSVIVGGAHSIRRESSQPHLTLCRSYLKPSCTGRKTGFFFFLSGHLIYILQQERLGRHGTFKSRALWSVKDGKGLTLSHLAEYCYSAASHASCLNGVLVHSRFSYAC
jgi:hypothetical protein